MTDCHVRVFVRVRPLNVSERRGRNAAIVECSGSKEVKIRDRNNTVKPKAFSFDQVFGPDSNQIDVYQSILSPMIDEVLCGYNCTVFAYGQTGSGKTFTMVGERSSDPNISWDVDPLCGLIPRALSHLFDKLADVHENYAVRVSYLELYNEELVDLLSGDEDVPKLKLYEDSARKGSVIVQGLEELEVSTKDEIYKILEKGSLRRQMAATNMNAHSSRSHTVFTITLHVKETLSDEDVIKTGRLNLVDLAGSENIGRSGSIDKRAREAGSINQSLLTLGRVITALTENAPHIPYRESKLTRLLKESLGGCTKTSIIATISPASSNLDETLSTLEYAFRARKITNRPEVNQKLTRKACISDYTEEIEHLRQVLLCNHEKSGVYLGYDDYMRMVANVEQLQEENERKLATLAALNEEMQKYEELCNKLAMKTERKAIKHQKVLNVLPEVSTECYEKSHLLEVHVETERKLAGQTVHLQSVANESSSQVYQLHSKLSEVALVENENIKRREAFRKEGNEKLTTMKNHIQEMQQKSTELSTDLKTVLSDNLEKRVQDYTSLRESVSCCLTQLQEIQDVCKCDNSECVKKLEQHIVHSLDEAEDSSSQLLHSLLKTADSELNKLEDEICKVENENEALRNIQWWQCLEEPQQMSKELDALQMSIQQYQELDLQEHLQLQQTLDDMLQQQLQINVAFESLDAQIKEVAESVQAQTSCQNETAAECDTLDVMKTSILEMFDRQADAYNKQYNLCKEQSEHVNSKFGTVVANAESQFTSALQSLSCIEAAASDAVKSYETKWKECTKHSLEEMDHLRQCTSENHQKCVQHTGALSVAVKEMVSNGTSMIQQQQVDFVEIVGLCHDSLDTHLDYVKKWGIQMSSKAEERQNEVEEFVNTGLSKEVRTGNTPERSEFQYPREIPSSIPDEDILEKFRMCESYNPTEATEIINISLTDSSCSSSSISGTSHSSLAKCLSSEDDVLHQRCMSTNNIAASTNTSELNQSTVSEPGFPSNEYGKENREVERDLSAIHKIVNQRSKKTVKRILVPKN